MSRAGSGRPVPEPPQLRHRLRPEPEHVPQPTSPSDQRLQRHSSRPVPLHVEQRGRASHLDDAGSPSPVPRLANATPASIPSPADAITTGETIFAGKPIQESPGNGEATTGEGRRSCTSWLSCRVCFAGAGRSGRRRDFDGCVDGRLWLSVVFVDGVRRFVGFFQGLYEGGCWDSVSPRSLEGSGGGEGKACPPRYLCLRSEERRVGKECQP